MLVAISGSQGSGKSSIITELGKLGYNTVTRKTSRSILSDWNVTLQEVNEDPELTIQFQDEIMIRKLADEYDATQSPDIWFTERTFADLFTYSLVSLGKNDQYSQFLNKYYHSCMRSQQTYDMVWYLPAGHFAVVGDGVRASNSHYSRMVDLTMREFTTQLTLSSRLFEIRTPDLSERVSIIKTLTETEWSKYGTR